MKLTIKLIESLKSTNKDQFFWDEELTGFGLRIKPTGVKSFFVQYRNASGISRRMTVGKFGVLNGRGVLSGALRPLTIGVTTPQAQKLCLGWMLAGYLSACNAKILLVVAIEIG